MRLTIRLLGSEVLHVSTEPEQPDEDDTARDLSGGSVSTTVIDSGSTDLYLGFTNGRGDE